MKSFLLCVLLLGCLFGSPLSAATIILTSDQQLNDLLDPEKKIDLSTGRNSRSASLREICEDAQRKGDKVLTIAFDEFFRQYRQQAGTERRLTPDMPEYQAKIKVIGDYAARHSMGIGLSLLSPLELGPAFANQTGESGRWVNYKVGYRDPVSGKFSLPIWQQLFWTNNKGKFPITLKKVRAFAFRESPVGKSSFKAVSPDDIIEIPDVQYEALDTLRVKPNNELWVGTSPEESQDMFFESRNLRVFSDRAGELPGYNRVMVLLEYDTPEMDYFSPRAAPFLKKLLTQYHEQGIDLRSLYSDEMHIQQDWYYFIHHENGQFNSRYLTKNFSAVYREKFQQEFEDKHLLYFVYGAPLYETGVKAVRNVQYVMGKRPEDIQRTFLLRDRYYKLLNHGVTDLFKEAKDFGDRLFGHALDAHGHASWAESPTIDLWDTEKLRENPAKYEYTSNYMWGNTVQQASAACYDYFKWSEYLEPTGNDFAECGWLDRNYYGAAMAASIGVINRVPQAYAAAWGMPAESRKWRATINKAFGARDKSLENLNLTGGVHRDIEALVLYPLSLVAVEERFGSWMTQYAYANYLTAEKLLELGTITDDGQLQVGDKRYRTLVAVFEPLPAEGLLALMRRFVEKGGKVVWFGPPPMLSGSGRSCVVEWQQLFGVQYAFDAYLGEIAAGRNIGFRSRFAAIPEQIILTDFLVDRIYPVKAGAACEILAESGGQTVGTGLKVGQGMTYFFGFRPRDDQAASLGYETRTMFEILNATGTYPGTGKFAGVNDNPTYVSRTTDYFATRFPNGSTMVVKHYRTHAETWDGGFSRNPEADKKALAANPMPSADIRLENFKVDGHELTYRGTLSVAFRTDAANRLIAFEGYDCQALTLDGVRHEFADQPLAVLSFAPVPEAPDAYAILVNGTGEIRLPLPLSRDGKFKLTAGKKDVPLNVVRGQVVVQITPELSGKILRLTPTAN